MKYHLAGIGGIGMSALAQFLIAQKHTVSGSNLEINDETEKLKKLGADIKIGHDSENLSKDCDVLVFNLAVASDNPELLKAKELGIPILTRTQATSAIFKDSVQIGIAGSHGKTTTTAMVAKIFIDAGLDPSFLIGGNLPNIGNAKLGKGPHFIFEADEFGNQFLDFNPAAAAINNVEADHLDFFGTFEGVKNAYKNFVSRLAGLGVLVVGETVPLEIFSKFKGIALTVGEGNANFKINNLVFESGMPKFDIEVKGRRLTTLKLIVPGKHNVYNATIAYVLALSSGIRPDIVEKSLGQFSGVERRFEVYLDADDLVLVDDYAHHPSEIKATLSATRERYPNKKIIAVFQPHQYSRTKYLLNDFAKSLSEADSIVLAPIYRLRDSDDIVASVSIEDLGDAIQGLEKDVMVLNSYDEIANRLKDLSEREKGIVILTMGAAPINEALKKLKEIVQ